MKKIPKQQIPQNQIQIKKVQAQFPEIQDWYLWMMSANM